MPTRRLEGPGAEAILLFSFGEEWRIGDATAPERALTRRESFAAGLHDTSVITEHDGLAHGMQVSLTPAGAYALFRVPLHELAHRTVPVDDVLGSYGQRLTEWLADAPDWPARFARLESALAPRLLDSRRPTPGVAWAWRRLRDSRGRVRIGPLGAELGWSRKRLNARFRDEIGLSPKSLARLLRFEHAADLLKGADRPSLTQLAVRCGFYDQSHLTNEFRRITGVTPASYAHSFGSATILQDTSPDRS